MGRGLNSKSKPTSCNHYTAYTIVRCWYVSLPFGSNSLPITKTIDLLVVLKTIEQIKLNCSTKILATYTRLFGHTNYIFSYTTKKAVQQYVYAISCIYNYYVSSSLQLLILCKTFVLFFWSYRIKYRFIVCALLRLLYTLS